MISILDKFGKDGLQISILETKISTFATKQIDVAMIGMDAYCTTCRLKWAKLLSILMTDLAYQVKKEARLETNLRTIVLAKYHDLLNVFSRKDLDTLLFYQKYDHEIILEKKQKHGQDPVY